MQRVVNFYQKLPRGAAPEVKATGILGRYQAKHFGKKPTGARMFLPPGSLIFGRRASLLI
jgi:F-type H+-transporting ATPase subunit f